MARNVLKHLCSLPVSQDLLHRRYGPVRSGVPFANRQLQPVRHRGHWTGDATKGVLYYMANSIGCRWYIRHDWTITRTAYDSIEGRFRIIKKNAKKHEDEIGAGIRPPAVNPPAPLPPTRPCGKKATAGDSQIQKVIHGRVEGGSLLRRVLRLPNPTKWPMGRSEI